MQLVLSNNRIIAHGENFIAMGGVVINTETGARFENATIAECAGCPSDIDSVGYEYHAGQFIPCEPFGKTDKGNIIVSCEECATPRRTDIPIGWNVDGPLARINANTGYFSLSKYESDSNTDIFESNLNIYMKASGNLYLTGILEVATRYYTFQPSHSLFELVISKNDEVIKTYNGLEIFTADIYKKNFAELITVNKGDIITLKIRFSGNMYGGGAYPTEIIWVDDICLYANADTPIIYPTLEDCITAEQLNAE